MKTSTVFRLTCLAACAPLTVVDSQLVRRLRVHSWPRVTVERMVETIETVTERALRTDRVHGGQLRKITALIDETAATGPVNPRRPRSANTTMQAAEHHASPPAAGTEVAAQHPISAAATGKKYAHVRAAASTNRTAKKHPRT